MHGWPTYSTRAKTQPSPITDRQPENQYFSNFRRSQESRETWPRVSKLIFLSRGNCLAKKIRRRKSISSAPLKQGTLGVVSSWESQQLFRGKQQKLGWHQKVSEVYCGVKVFWGAEFTQSKVSAMNTLFPVCSPVGRGMKELNPSWIVQRIRTIC